MSPRAAGDLCREPPFEVSKRLGFPVRACLSCTQVCLPVRSDAPAERCGQSAPGALPWAQQQTKLDLDKTASSEASSPVMETCLRTARETCDCSRSLGRGDTEHSPCHQDCSHRPSGFMESRFLCPLSSLLWVFTSSPGELQEGRRCVSVHRPLSKQASCETYATLLLSGCSDRPEVPCPGPNLGVLLSLCN